MTVEELLAWEVPAPFVKEQKLKLRDCKLEDLENAAKVIRATEGPEIDAAFLMQANHILRYIGSNAFITKARFDDIQRLVQIREEQLNKPRVMKKKTPKKTTSKRRP